LCAATATEELASFDAKARDELDALSKKRAEVLAEMNAQIAWSANRSPAFSNALFDSLGSNFYWRSFCGLWAYNSRCGCYTFLPFGSCSSPDGFYYPSVVYVPFVSTRDTAHPRRWRNPARPSSHHVSS
jgi:hypothetical protein